MKICFANLLFFLVVISEVAVDQKKKTDIDVQNDPDLVVVTTKRGPTPGEIGHPAVQVAAARYQDRVLVVQGNSENKKRTKDLEDVRRRGCHFVTNLRLSPFYRNLFLFIS